MTGLSFIWHYHLFYKKFQNYHQYGCQILHLLPPPNHPPYSLLRFQVSSSFKFRHHRHDHRLSDPVVWRFLQSSSANQVNLDMCPPCLCTKCSPHLEQNGLFAISFSNLPDSMNLPTMNLPTMNLPTYLLNGHHHVDHLTRNCLLAWRYSATWSRVSASTRSTCQKKEKDEK